MIRWSICALACAGGSAGLGWLVPAAPLRNPFGGAALLPAWLVLPFAAVLVPLLWPRRAPLRRRKVAWQFLVPVVAGVALGVLGKQAGDQDGLADRGRWTEAVVVHGRLTATCAIRVSPGLWTVRHTQRKEPAMASQSSPRGLSIPLSGTVKARSR